MNHKYYRIYYVDCFIPYDGSVNIVINEKHYVRFSYTRDLAIKWVKALTEEHPELNKQYPGYEKLLIIDGVVCGKRSCFYYIEEEDFNDTFEKRYNFGVCGKIDNIDYYNCLRCNEIKECMPE